MKRAWKFAAALVAIALMFSAFVTPAFAGTRPPVDCKSIYIVAAHGINGERLGLPKALPVDVYVNGGYAFTFKYKETVGPIKLPAGNYKITVNLAGTQTQVMSLGPVEIPGGVNVTVVAKLVKGVPTLLPKIRQLPCGN